MASPLIGLPREIRDMIYYWTLKASNDPEMGLTEIDSRMARLCNIPPILQVSSQIRQEAQLVLYSRCTLFSGHSLSTRQEYPWIPYIACPVRSSIQYLHRLPIQHLHYIKSVKMGPITSKHDLRYFHPLQRFYMVDQPMFLNSENIGQLTKTLPNIAHLAIYLHFGPWRDWRFDHVPPENVVRAVRTWFGDPLANIKKVDVYVSGWGNMITDSVEYAFKLRRESRKVWANVTIDLGRDHCFAILDSDDLFLRIN